MWFSSAPKSHSTCLILMLFALGRTSQSSAVGRQSGRQGANSTSSTSSFVYHSSSKHSSASSTSSALYESNTGTAISLSKSSTFTPGAAGVPTTSTRDDTIAASEISSIDKSTITSSPAFSTSQYPWGTQIIPLNTCSFVAPEGDIEYSPCHVSAGEIKLSYFPENNGNTTYPSTYYAPDLGITMTSPLIYMLIMTITGDNNCGPLGPTYSNKVISMNITDVSTLPPYADATTQERIGGQERQLTLSDLLDCPSATIAPASSVLTNPHPISDVYNRCNPRLVFPEEASAIGYPFWVHCGADNYRVGIFDPPGAVPPVTNLLPTTAAVPYTSTYESPSAAPIVTPPSASTSQVPPPVEPTTTLVATEHSTTQPEVTQTASLETPSTAPSPTEPEPLVSQQSQTIVTASILQSEPSQPAIIVTESAILNTAPSAPPVVSPIQTSASVGVPAASGIPSSNPAISPVSPITNLPNPIVPAPSQPPSAPIPTTTVTLGSGDVIATVNGLTVSATPGVSTLGIGTQILSAGGPVVTLQSKVVATLGASQLIVEYPSGTVSVFNLPTGTAEIVAPAGSSISISTETPAEIATVVIGSQTVSIGGPAVTLSNSDVVTLGSTGLGIQVPGSTNTTIDVATSSATTGLGNVIASFLGISPTSSTATSEISSSSMWTSTTTQNPVAPSTLTTSSEIPSSVTNSTIPTKTSIGGSTATASPTLVRGAGSRMAIGCTKIWGLLGVIMLLMY